MKRMLIVCLIAVAILAVVSMTVPGAEAANKTWIGGTNTAWSQGNNWDPAGVPNSSHDVYIPDVSNDPVIQSDAEANLVQINDSASLEIDGGTLTVSGNLRVNNSAALDILNNASELYVGSFFQTYGTTNCSGHSPEINIGGSMYAYYSDSFIAGNSTVLFNGTGGRHIYSPSSAFHDLVMNNTSLSLSVAGPVITVGNNFTIWNGTFRVANRTVRVGNDFHCHGELEMTYVNDLLDVSGDVLFYNGSSTDVTEGEIQCGDEWHVFDGADMQLGGDNMVVFDDDATGYESIEFYDADSYFHNVTISKSSNDIELITTHPVNITGDLVVDQAASDQVFDVWNAQMIVHGNVTVKKGQFMYWGGGSVDIMGYMMVGPAGGIVLTSSSSLNITGNLTVEGDVNLNGTGCRITVDGFTFVQNGGRILYHCTLAEFFAGNDVYINSSSALNMDSGNAHFNMTGSTNDRLRINGGTVNLTNDDAHLAVGIMQILSSAVLNCSGNSPTIDVSNNWYNTGTFDEGSSTVRFKDSYSYVYFTEIFWNVVVDTSSMLRLGAAVTISGTLFIERGALDLFNHTLTVQGGGTYSFNGTDYRGFINHGGTLEMSHVNDELIVNSNVHWGPSSDADVTEGTIYCNYGNWTFESGSAVNLTGNSDVSFQYGTASVIHYIYTNSSTSSFNNLSFYRGSLFTSMSTRLAGTEPCVVDVHMLVRCSFGDLYIGNGTLTVWGDLDVERGDLWLDGECNVTVHGDVYTEYDTGMIFTDNGDINVGQNASFGGGTFDIDGTLTIDGGVTYYGTGGDLAVSGNVTVTSNGHLDFRGTAGNLTAPNIVLNGQLSVFSNDTTIETWDLIIRWSLHVGGNNHPLFLVGGDFDWNNVGIIDMGKSEVRFYGNRNQSLEDDITYWGLVMDKNGGDAVPESFNFAARSYFAIASGGFDLWSTGIKVGAAGNSDDGYWWGGTHWRGFIIDDAQFNMTNAISYIDVGHATFLSGSTGTFSAGTIYCSGDWRQSAGSAVNMSGTVTRFDGSSGASIWSYSTDFSVSDVYLEKSNNHVFLQSSSNQPFVVKGDAEVDMNLGSFWTGADMLITGDLRVLSNPMVIRYGGEVDVWGKVRIGNTGKLQVGHSTSRGYLYVDGYISIASPDGLNINGTGGSVEVIGEITVDSNFTIDSDNTGSTYVSCEQLRVHGTGLLRCYSNYTTIETSLDVFYNGTIWVHDDATPRFVVHDDWNQYGPGRFYHGQSEVWFQGGQDFQYMDPETYWIVVINKTNGFAYPLNDNVYIDSCLFILNGTFNTFGFTVTVNGSTSGFLFNATYYTGFVNYGGHLKMLSSDDVMDVNGPVVWGPGSTDDIQDGEFYCNGSWAFEAGSEATMDNITVEFDGTNSQLFGSWAWLISNSTGSYFTDVVVDRDPGYGVATYWSSTETLRINGDLTVDNFAIVHSEVNVTGHAEFTGPESYIDTEFNGSYGDAVLNVGGDVYVQTGALLGIYNPFNNGSLLCEDLIVNGTLSITYQGWINVSGQSTVYGTIDIQGRGSWNTNGGSLTVASGSLIGMSNYKFAINATGSVLLQSGSTTRLYSNDGYLRSGAYLVVLGTLDCAGYAPEIHVGADWSSSASATFTPGYSTVFFEGTGVDTSIDHTGRFYDIVVDISLRTLTLETDVSVNKMNLATGTVELGTYNLTVRSDLSCTDTLQMNGDVMFTVIGDVYYYSGCEVSVTNGTNVVSGSMTIYDGSDVNYSGTSLLRFNSSSPTYWRNHDPGANFGNVQINKSSWAYTYGSTQPVYVNGDLSIYAKGTWFGLSVQNSTLAVAGDLTIDRGELLISNGNVTVNGTVTCSNEAFVVVLFSELNAQGLNVDGTLYLNGTGSVVHVSGSAYIPGSDIIFTGNNTYMYVDGDLWVNSTGIVNMTGTDHFTLEVNGTLKLYGWLNMTNDNATLICHGSLDIWPSGTLYVGGTSEPDLHFFGSFNGLGPASVFVPGHSVIHLEGSAFQTLEDDFDYWGIVINKTGSWSRFESGTGSVPNVESFFFMTQGTFNIMDNDIMVNSSGSGYYHNGSWYTGFANYGGYLFQTNENGTLDVNGPVYWGPSSTEYVTDGEIYVSDSWITESGAIMTFTDKHHVYFDGSVSAMYYGYATGSQFRNVTVSKDPSYVLVFGGGLMNVTNTLTIDSTDGIDVSDYRLEAYGIVHDDGELNVSGSLGEVYVWDTLAMDSTATLWMANGSYAYITDFTGMGTIWLGNGTNLTVVDDLYMPSGTLHPGESMVYFTGSASTSIGIGGSFHDLVADKDAINQVAFNGDLYVEGDLTILMAAFYPQANDLYVRGDYYCSPSARFAQSATNPGKLIFNGGTDQYVRTGGTNTYHDIQNMTVTGSGTTVRLVDYSVSITDTLTIDPGAYFWFVADNETLYTGSGGIMNNGTFRVTSSSGPIDVVIYAGSDVVNNGMMYFEDYSWVRAMHLMSSSSGTQWNFIDNTPSKSNPSVFHVNVSDSDASLNNSVYAGSGYNHDDGNNDNWIFSYRIGVWFHDNDGHEMNMTVYRYGVAVVINRSIGVWDWSDENSTVTLQDEYTVTSNEERYYTEDTTSWVMNSDVSVHVYYYRQWKPTITLDGTDTSHTVSAYYTTLAGTTSQSNQHTSWSRWVDNGTALSYSKEATGAPVRHTSEDFTAAPWDPLTSALVRTVYYSGNDIPELYNGSMDPSGGNMTTMFNFTVEYWDANDDAPHFIYVNIDGTNHTMEKVDDGDSDYVDGVEYYYETLLSGGDHDYYFICNDTYVTNQTSTETTGTIIPEFGMLPVMISVMMVGVAVIWRRRRR